MENIIDCIYLPQPATTDGTWQKLYILVEYFF